MSHWSARKDAASQGNRQTTLLRQLVTATQRLTKPLCVEYVAAAEDGMGRLYARQISAQSLAREARYLLYGQTHKEVDMSGAHYEILRRCVGASQIPPIAQLREAIRNDCRGAIQDSSAFAKLLPLRLLNTNVARTLAFAKEQGYIPAGHLTSLFWEIETLRNHFLPAVLHKHRSGLEVCFRNRNYHACETVESRVMQQFYCNLSKREPISSAIWLHDGMWVNHEVSDDAIRLAETETLRNVFSGFSEQEPIFKIVSLAAHFTCLQGQLDNVAAGPPLLSELPRRFRHFVTPQHSFVHFQQKRVDPRAEERQDQYIERVSKRPRL